jgi:subtilisin-like proprotein convertase family protein
LLIEKNTRLTNLDGLSSLTSVGGDLGIASNSNLTNINGLSSLTRIGGGLSIHAMLLTNLDGLSSLTSVGGSLVIWGNYELINLDGLSNLPGVGGDLRIENNTKLTNLDGLSSLTSVGGVMVIYYNIVLTNLDGLSSLTSIGGGLGIWENWKLTNLDGLSNLPSVGGDLDINSNPVLSRCTALSPLLGWPDGPPNDDVAGAITVGGNASGCNSVEEILASVSAPTAPSITASEAAYGQATLTFLPSTTTDTFWMVTGYYAQCLADEQFVFQNSTAMDIPDEGAVFSSLTVFGIPSKNAAGLTINVDITHPRTSHLTLALTSPSGTSVMLWNEAGGDGTDLIGTFPSTLEPAESLSAYDGEDFNGEWQLTVSDGIALQTGTLNSWGITVRDKVTATTETSPATLIGLADSRSYSCTVSALTGLGIGPASNTVSLTPTPDLIFSGGFEEPVE